jgi:dolichyl-phosphate-mannose-protein mannosyltransferase
MSEKKTIFLIFFLALLLRQSLAFLPGFLIDMNAWYAWSHRLAEFGFSRFYTSEFWTNYTPGYLYILFFLGQIKSVIPLNYPLIQLIYKLPNILTDLICGWLVYQVVASKSKKLALLAVIFYLFNPAVIFNSSIWGQADSFLTLLILTSVILILNKKIVSAAVSLAMAFLVKPQAIFILPISLMLIYKKRKIIDFFWYLLVILITTLFLAWPFFKFDQFFGLFLLIWQMSKDYPFTTLNAFNFWQLWGNWQSDKAIFLGLTKQTWGYLLVFFGQTAIAVRLLITKTKKKDYYLAVGLSWLVFVLFATRMHERYLLPCLVFILIAGCLKKSILLIISYWLITIVHFINLYYVYCLYQPNFLKINFIFEIIAKERIIFSLLSLIIFGILLLVFLNKKWLVFFDEKINKIIKKIISYKINKKQNSASQKKMEEVKNVKIWLWLILLFAFLTRIINLWYPQAYIFDEVYHAFTAQEMVKGNPAAWEWWNTPPSGFAYEWTHPPLAKLIMAAGIIFGRSIGISNDFFSWRLPAAIFGTAAIYLIYLLARKLFQSEKIALIAAILLSLEGLTLVMSRIGMSDIYFLFFALLSLWLGLEKKWFFMGVVWGLALATKWTGVYLSLPLFILFYRQNLKKPYGFYRWLLFMPLPILVYFFSYSLFFTSGHNLNQFWELQNQMWVYHTGLKATHNYQSKPYSWPLDLRPVWFYVNYQNDGIGNIYALGNPLIFWLGLTAIPAFICEAFEKKSKKYLFIILLYLIFWTPWIASPRIMFLYHYLPSVPFLVMILAWLINALALFSGKRNVITLGFLLLISASFVFFYPIWTGVVVSKNLLNYFFWLPTWK